MRVGFLVFDDLEELDLLGPWELFGVWADCNDGPSERLLIGEHAGPVRCAKGLQLVADVSLADGGQALHRDTPTSVNETRQLARLTQSVVARQAIVYP